MTKLTEVIYQDSQRMFSFAKGFVKGVFPGLYTPFLIPSGIDYAKNNLCHSAESLGNFVAQVEVAIFSQVHLANLAIKQDRFKEYLGIMAITNVANYLIHAYKRSKKSELASNSLSVEN